MAFGDCLRVVQPGAFISAGSGHAAANCARYPPSPWLPTTARALSCMGSPFPVEPSTSPAIGIAYLPNVLTFSYLRVAAQTPARRSGAGAVECQPHPGPTPGVVCGVIGAA